MNLLEAISNQTDVSLSLAKQVLLRHAKHSNSVFSPLSIHVVLSLIASGAKGSTLDELLSYLNSNSSEDLNSLSSQVIALVFAVDDHLGGPKLSFANAAWIDQSLSLKSSFKHVVEDVYKASCNQVDFQTKAVEITGKVNAWAEKETKGLIKELLPPGSVDSSSKLILTNALYFKGSWTEKFDASETEDRDFYLVNGNSVKVPFMTSYENQFVSAFDDFKVLGLPYEQGHDKRSFSMYIFLPNSKEEGGLTALVEKLNSQPPGFLDRHLPYKSARMGEFLIPKFKISFGFEASEVLMQLGLISPFTEGGGLTEMVDDSSIGQQLYVSKIFHKSFVQVNEEGTEAAAASAVCFEYTSLTISDVEDDPIDFVADHPFLFIIREDQTTGVILFIGQVFNPLED
ncbi:serpin-ZX-like [Impatiens glandulifera]|uniref:serpin-ZX-like n=1 Tax=Impatiens glandulifera TaxID=253017 RepID=UPI001FB06126|nr:serpin-ZX-like [Impatiens glandulifera]